MPNKSDSAGKIHEYFTYLAIRKYFNINGESPFDSKKELSQDLFTPAELSNLQAVSQLSCDIIARKISELCPEDVPVFIEHVGANSGTGVQDITDDVVILMRSKNSIRFSLKCANTMNQILSRNMGAKSIIQSYFGSAEKQKAFNVFLETAYREFLNGVFQTKDLPIAVAKKFIKTKAKNDGYSKDRFAYYSNAEKLRDVFLKRLPEELKNLVSDLPKEQLCKAANLITDAGSHIIYATYGKKIQATYACHEKISPEDFIHIALRDNRSMVLVFSSVNVGFRFKFESSITSSIKLVGDYSWKK